MKLKIKWTENVTFYYISLKYKIFTRKEKKNEKPQGPPSI